MLRKFIAAAIATAVFFSLLPAAYAANENIMPEADSIMAEGNSWKPFESGKISVESVSSLNGEETVLKCTDLGKYKWASPSVEIGNAIKKDVEKNGDGIYEISFEVMLDGTKGIDYEVSCVIRSTNKTSISPSETGGENPYYGSIGRFEARSGQWTTVTTAIKVTKGEVEGEISWLFCFDSISTSLKTIWLDDFKVRRAPEYVDTKDAIRAIDSIKFPQLKEETSVEKVTGVNLIPQADYVMETSNSWQMFGTGEVGTQQTATKEGKKDQALRATGLGVDTWSSPSYDIYNAIKADVEKYGSGRYAITFNFMYEGKEGEEYDFNILVRASNKTDLFSNGDGGVGGYRVSFGRGKIVTGTWRNVSLTFGISETDVQGEDTWKLCFDGIKEDIKSIWIDDFTLMRVSDDATPKVKNFMCVDSPKYMATGGQQTSNDEETKEETKKGINLLENYTSTFSGLATWEQSGWESFSAGKMSLSDEGYSGNCLKMETPEKTWGSPALNVYNYIDEPGQYTFAVFVKYDGNNEKKFNFIIRGTQENSFIQKSGSNFIGPLGAKKVTAGQWSKVVFTFNVTADDLKTEDSWKICISTVDNDIQALYFDEAVLIKGDASNLPDDPTPDEGVILEQKAEKEEKQLYDPETKDVAVKTLIITAVVVFVVISTKIFLPMVIKKLNKQGEEK